MEGAAPSRKEGRGTRRSTSFSGVVGGVPGLSRTTLKGPGEDGEEEEERSDDTEGVPAPTMTCIMANFQAASVSESSRLHL
ncbi:hypothetical protein O181_101607 [Austropuccinia psidii MF-1]|uniref:Uncharacterized protein n=1 Tax=Austropuccinia psidii MF-1 TaxID=1389203 RepID=A0A9Q3PIP7_9BASI|nr:hypothetical protein [Austropuccinia psidii MF-1]